MHAAILHNVSHTANSAQWIMQCVFCRLPSWIVRRIYAHHHRSQWIQKKNSRTKEEATETNALHIYFFIRFSCWNHMDDVRKHISLVMKHHTDDAAERTKYICSKRKIMTKNRRRKKSSSRRSLHLRSDAKAHNANCIETVLPRWMFARITKSLHKLLIFTMSGLIEKISMLDIFSAAHTIGYFSVVIFCLLMLSVVYVRSLHFCPFNPETHRTWQYSINDARLWTTTSQYAFIGHI